MDIVLDSGHLVELLEQYYDENRANYGYGRFRAEGLFSCKLTNKLNNVIRNSEGLHFSCVIASTFTFVEISRKWEEMVGNKFTEEQFYVFAKETPTWFNIAPVDDQLTPFSLNVPNYNSKSEPIEWTDAIHMATVLSRGDDASSATLATTDRKLKQMLVDLDREVL